MDNAKIYKVTAYIVDPNGGCSTDSYIENTIEGLDMITHHIEIQEQDIGEWYDEHPLNRCDCPKEECEKFFSPKLNEWICMGDVGVTVCPVCGWSIEECIDDKYCRNCGSKMNV